MPKPRQRLNILGRNWRVHFVRSKIKKEAVECDGHTDRDRHLIRVSLNIAKDRIRSTLLHEVLHAVIDMTTSVHHADEEKCVQALESGLFPVIRHPDNRWMVDYLLEED